MTRHHGEWTPQRGLRRLQLPQPLGLPKPHRLPDPHALREPHRVPEPLGLPEPAPAPDALELPSALRVVVEREPAHVVNPKSGVIPELPRGSLPVSSSRPTIASKSLPQPPPSELGAPRRSFRIPTMVWLLAACAIGIAALSGGQHSPTTPVSPPPVIQAPGSGSPGASAPQSVGMPIPTGNAPVRPIRIVLDVTTRPIPADERRALGIWIERTQNVATRIRVESRGRLSRPLTGSQWARSPATAMTRGDALIWLERGVRKHRAGALERLGVSGVSRMLMGDVRESDVPAPSSVLRVHNKLASVIAREIMITSQQGYGGTTAP
jgi:hypothetical protein